MQPGIIRFRYPYLQVDGEGRFRNIVEYDFSWNFSFRGCTLSGIHMAFAHYPWLHEDMVIQAVLQAFKPSLLIVNQVFFALTPLTTLLLTVMLCSSMTMAPLFTIVDDDVVLTNNDGIVADDNDIAIDDVVLDVIVDIAANDAVLADGIATNNNTTVDDDVVLTDDTTMDDDAGLTHDNVYIPVWRSTTVR